MILGSSASSVCTLIFSGGREEEGGGEEGRGGGVEVGMGGGGGPGGIGGPGGGTSNFGVCAPSSCFPLPVTSLGGAMATNLITPFDRPLIMDSAVATSTPIRDVSLMERRWSPTLRGEGGRDGGRE